MTMTKSQAINLSNLIRDIRPDWDFHGIMAALVKLDGDLGDMCVAVITAAKDPLAETPAAASNPVYWPKWSIKANDEKRLDQTLRSEQIRQRRWRMELEQDAARASKPETIGRIRAEGGLPRRTNPEGEAS